VVVSVQDVNRSLFNLENIRPGQVAYIGKNLQVFQAYNWRILGKLSEIRGLWKEAAAEGDELIKIAGIFEKAVEYLQNCQFEEVRVERILGALGGVQVLVETYRTKGKCTEATALQVVFNRGMNLLGNVKEVSHGVEENLSLQRWIDQRTDSLEGELKEELAFEEKECLLPNEGERIEEAFAQLGRTVNSSRRVEGECGSFFHGVFSNSTSTLRKASALGRLARGVEFCVSGVSKVVIENKHPWKQKKYQFAIREMLSAFTLICDGESVISLIGRIYEEKAQGSRGLRGLAIDVLSNLIVDKGDGDFRGQYYQILDSLRRTCEHKDFQEAVAEGNLSALSVSNPVNIILNLCLACYHEVQLYSFSESLVDCMLDAGKKRGENYETEIQEHRISEEDFSRLTRIPSEVGAMRIAVEKGKLQGTVNVKFDPNKQSNVPYVLVDIDCLTGSGEEKKVRLLRMASPTIEGFLTEAIVNPEFKAFLIDRRRKRKHHTYISLQSVIPRPGSLPNTKALGDETGRNTAIRKLEDEFSDTFTFVILDQDSKFYTEPAGDEECTTVSFKDLFLGQLLGLPKETGFYFPEKWIREETFREELEKVFDDVHKLIFAEDGGSKVVLDLQERKDFVEIYYAFLILHILQKTSSDSANISCKDAIDRAAKTNTLLLKIVMIIEGKGDDAEAQKMLQKMAHAPALMVKKQAIIRKRRERLLSALVQLDRGQVQRRLRTAALLGTQVANPMKSIVPEVRRYQDVRMTFSQVGSV
jgi:hypothetical protein